MWNLYVLFETYMTAMADAVKGVGSGWYLLTNASKEAFVRSTTAKIQVSDFNYIMKKHKSSWPK